MSQSDVDDPLWGRILDTLEEYKIIEITIGMIVLYWLILVCIQIIRLGLAVINIWS